MIDSVPDCSPFTLRSAFENARNSAFGKAEMEMNKAFGDARNCSKVGWPVGLHNSGFGVMQLDSEFGVERQFCTRYQRRVGARSCMSGFATLLIALLLVALS